MSSPSPDPQPDYAALRYPSDRLTVADLSRAHPDRFDPPLGDAFEALEDDRAFGLSDLLFCERLLARAAFERALTPPRDALRAAGLTGRDECLDTLAGLYERYGLATGRHHADELVKPVEAQAARQAGRGR